MTVPFTFSNESSPIPLSQLDANFAAPIPYANTAGNVANAAQPNITSVGVLTALSVSGNIDSGNLRTGGGVSAVGNIITIGNISGGNIVSTGILSALGNVTVGGRISAIGNITGNNFFGSGNLTANNITGTGVTSLSGTVTGGNLITAGIISAGGNITTQGNAVVQGQVSAVGNISTAQFFVGNFRGNIVGNLSVGGSNTQVLFNQSGNVGAAGGLTYNAGSNTLTVLGVVSAQGGVIAQGNITTQGSLSVGGNIIVGQNTQLLGVVTAPTALAGTANNQLATTAFTNNSILALNLSDMAVQSSSNVNITGGKIAGTFFGNIALSTNWKIVSTATKLYFQFNGVSVASLDSSGNFVARGNIAGFGTP